MDSQSESTDALGAHWTGEGVNFALFSAHATSVELCLFESPDAPHESERIPLARGEDDVWRVFVPHARPGRAYGYRVDGPWDPESGHRFQPSKLLLDPCAPAVCGRVDWDPAVYGYELGHPEEELARSDADSAPHMPRGLVVDHAFDWQGDAPPRTPWTKSVVYEAHVRGLTMRHPAVPDELRGTYLGLAHDAVVEHLLELGVTAVELLPVAHIEDEQHLIEKGLTNYWGYSTLGFCAPSARYATGERGEQVREFQEMVRALHRAGIEVLLDVVLNHTPEGGRLGPTLSLRGIDNRSYYRIARRNPREYVDWTGCGNTVDFERPGAVRLGVETLRHWVDVYHVDGFRFDEAPILGRRGTRFDPEASFFEAVRADPALRECKLIAEPWDVGPQGYQLASFPPEWSEWNDKFRDTVRRYWRGDPSKTADLATRLAGSSDLFGAAGRPPSASIHFVACHDGFTLNDVVTYESKSNEANGEENRDGHDHNWTRNWGVEGETDNARVLRLRRQARKNMLATVMLSQGVPMILYGDELGRTQGGNNNAYCQDNETSWIDWELSETGRELLEFVRELARLRRDFPVLRRRDPLHGTPDPVTGRPDVRWLTIEGHDMEPADWEVPEKRAFAMLLDGGAQGSGDDGAELGGSLLVLFNGGYRAAPFHLPGAPDGGRWRLVFATADPTAPQDVGADVAVAPRSMTLLETGREASA